MFFSCSVRNKDYQVPRLFPDKNSFVCDIYLSHIGKKSDGSVRVQSRSVNQYLDHWWARLSFWALLSISWWMSYGLGHRHVIITQKTFWTSGYEVEDLLCNPDISLYEIYLFQSVFPPCVSTCFFTSDTWETWHRMHIMQLYNCNFNIIRAFALYSVY